MPNIAVLDYDMGNLHSACKGLQAAGANPIVTCDPEVVAGADGIVLPGVGAFDPAMDKLRAAGLEPVIQKAIAQGKPFLGICLGLQLLFESSEEGTAQGLGILKGQVRRFQAEPDLSIPHMGWNQLHLTQPQCPLWQGLPPRPWMYFVHSYYPVPSDPAIIAGETTHGRQTIPVAIAQGNLMAVQFHPEKSADQGIKLLANFVKLTQRLS
jgi:glutamine amidotransferase